MTRRGSWFVLLLVGLLALGGGGLAFPAEGAPASVAADGATRARGLNGSELQAFVDPYVAQSMAAAHVPGAAVVFVKDGKILYARGYGFADLARRTPVDPERTVFRVASVSKLVTASAVMQLVDRGQVRLDADVNHYLRGFQVPATYPQPVTLSDLLTHTAGFEDRNIGRATLTSANFPSLQTYLATRTPQRVTPPGTLYSYSNYGFALAGYVVEAATGQPFDQYVAKEVFHPLGMEHSSFAQPLPSTLADSLATGYDVSGTNPVPAPFEYLADAPAEAMSTTAEDMARFMIFQLGEGTGAGRVLSPRALADLQALHFRASPDADVNGMAYGYSRYQRNGVLILSKEGDVRGFASYLALFPDQHLGVFVVANTSDNAWIQDLERRLVNQFFPIPAATPPVTPSALRGSLAQFAGTYVPNRSSRTTIEKLRTLTQQVRIDDLGDGRILVSYPDGSAVRLTRVGPLAFANVYEGVTYRWAFLAEADGRVAHFLIGNDVYNRVEWYDARSIQLGIAVALALLFLVGFGSGMAPALARLQSSQKAPDAPSVRQSNRASLARALGCVLCGLNLLFIAAGAALLDSATATQGLDYSWLTYGTPTIVYALLCLPLVTTVLAFGLLASTVLAWRSHAWHGAEYRYVALATLAQIAFIPFLLHWNLFGFHV